MPADDSRELFDVVDELTGEPLHVTASGKVAQGTEEGERGDDDGGDDGKPSTSTSAKKRLTVPRGLAHSNGTWHASVYIHLSRAKDGAFLMQRRSSKKDVCPLLWDLACAEHLASGEARVEAALRGLREELGLEGVTAERLGEQLGPPRQAVLRIEGPEEDQQPVVYDREVITSYWLRSFDFEEKTIKFDEDEVCEIRWVSPSDLKNETEDKDAEGRFTPWFLAELRARPELLERR